MKKLFCNEKGNASFFMIWLLGIVALIFIIIVNISNAFVTGAHASNTSEQAAIAGTSVIISETKSAIDKYDDDPLSEPDRKHHDKKKLAAFINKKKDNYRATGLSDNQAYIKALNEVLPSEIEKHELLKETIVEHFNHVGLNNKIYTTVTSVVSDNHGNSGDTQVVLSDTDWRLEVETSVDYHSISDRKYIPEINDKMSSLGVGPNLKYLEKIF